MEIPPKWDQVAEDLMGLFEHETDPSKVQTYQNEIKTVYCEDENGKTTIISIDADSDATGPYVNGPFNPNLN